jgi:GTP-binding protein
MKALDEAAQSYQVVLTKADQVKPEALEQVKAPLAEELSRHAAAHPDIIATSARTGQGVSELRAALAALALAEAG